MPAETCPPQKKEKKKKKKKMMKLTSGFDHNNNNNVWFAFFCTICIKLFETCYVLLFLPAAAAAAANATLQSRSLAHLRTI